MPLTADDLAAYLQMKAGPPAAGSVDRAEFDRFLSAAVSGVTRMCGWLDAQTVTVTVPTLGAPLLTLPYVRLAAVGSIVDAGGVAVTATWVDLEAGIVGMPSAVRGQYTVTVTGRPWPDELRIAALEWARHLYGSQRTRLRPDDDEPSPLLGFALPNRVTELITPYRTPGIA